MKKLTLSLALLFPLVFGAAAQDSGIKFESSKQWHRIVEAAKRDKKMIFIYCYKEGGQSRTLAANLFNKSDVGSLFNEKFVNVQYDFANDRDAIEANIQYKWGVEKDPTFLFIDPATETPVHMLVGRGDAAWLLKGGNDALSPQRNLMALLKRYNQGARGPAFVGDVIDALKNAGMRSQMQQVMGSYFDGMSAEDMASGGNWKLIQQYANDPVTRPLKTVIDNVEIFHESLQPEAVDQKIGSAIVSTAVEFATTPNMLVIDAGRYDAFLRLLNTIEGPVKDMSAIWLNTMILGQQKKWQDLLETVQIVHEDKLLQENQMGLYLATFCKSLAESGNKKIIDPCIEWLDAVVANVQGDDYNACYQRAAMTEVKLIVAQTAGRTGVVNKTHSALEEYLKTLQKLQK